MKKKYAIGIDIGGSHISAILFDINRKEAVAGTLVEVKINNKASSNEIISKWSSAIKQVLDKVAITDLLGIGFAIPGSFNYEQGVSLIKGVDKYESLYGINVGEAIRAELSLPDELVFRYVNDATSFAIGECWVSKAASYKRVVAITLGTGLGSSFIIDGVPVIEGDNIPAMGYVYDIPYANSIADDHFSTRWFVREWKARTGEACSGAKDIVDRAETDLRAKTLLHDFGFALGMFMGEHLKKFEAQCLVIGGNISGAWSWFEPEMRRAFEEQGLSVEIHVSNLGELSAMAGAARLLDDEFWKDMKSLISKY